MNTAPSPLAPLSCLVVDDQPSSRDVVTACLKALGVTQISFAANGSEAFTILNTAARPFCEALRDRGVLCKETHETVIRIAPPLVIGREDLDWGLEQVEAVLGED